LEEKNMKIRVSLSVEYDIPEGAYPDGSTCDDALIWEAELGPREMREILSAPEPDIPLQLAYETLGKDGTVIARKVVST